MDADAEFLRRVAEQTDRIAERVRLRRIANRLDTAAAISNTVAAIDKATAYQAKARLPLPDGHAQNFKPCTACLGRGWTRGGICCPLCLGAKRVRIET